MAGKYRLSTLGCKVNQYESQQIRELLDSLGLHPAAPHENPDIAVVNTCAVTACASRKSRQTIRRLARNGTSVFVVGCGVSADAERFRAIDGVVAAFGHDTDICAELRPLVAAHSSGVSPSDDGPKHDSAAPQRPPAERDDVSMIPMASGKNNRAGARRTRVPLTEKIFPRELPVVKSSSFLDGRIARFAGHQRAFLKVQDGCDAFCTYCIIPRLRPKVGWKPVDAAVAEARGLVRAGHKEIVVTGIFLGAYGRDTAVRRRFRPDRTPLADLVNALAGVEGLERLRLSSLEPGDMNEALSASLAAHPCCVPHFHLPLQSGSPRILRRMNRQYTADSFAEMIDRVRAVFERPAITTDIIVGFPGETEAEFDETLKMARWSGFSKIHAFPFSPRSGTAAYQWQADFVDSSVVQERIRRLGEVESDGSLAFRREALGTVERVLVEGEPVGMPQATSPGGVRHGRTDRYFDVAFPATDGVRRGDLVHVRIDRVTAAQTLGTLVAG